MKPAQVQNGGNDQASNRLIPRKKIHFNFVGRNSALMMIATLTLSATAAYAIPITFTTSLSGANEVPAVVTPGAGFATVFLDPTANTLQVNVTFGNLTSPTTASHIHCCVPPGMNAIVATTTPTFPGFPLGVTAQGYVSPVFDLTMSSSYNPAFITANGGSPFAGQPAP